MKRNAFKCYPNNIFCISTKTLRKNCNLNEFPSWQFAKMGLTLKRCMFLLRLICNVGMNIFISAFVVSGITTNKSYYYLAKQKEAHFLEMSSNQAIVYLLYK